MTGSPKTARLIRLQSRAQLDAVGSSFADELDDTIATKIILRVQGDATSQYAVRLLGQFESHEVGTSESSAGEGTSGTSLRYIQRARIEPRQLRELQAGEAYISTLAKLDNKMVNPLWKLRLPLPDFAGWQNISMPPAREHEEGGGFVFVVTLHESGPVGGDLCDRTNRSGGD